MFVIRGVTQIFKRKKNSKTPTHRRSIRSHSKHLFYSGVEPTTRHVAYRVCLFFYTSEKPVKSM